MKDNLRCRAPRPQSWHSGAWDRITASPRPAWTVRERETGKGGKEDKEEIKHRGTSFKGHVFSYFIMNYVLLRQGLLYLGCPKSLCSYGGFGTLTLLPLPLKCWGYRWQLQHRLLCPVPHTFNIFLGVLEKPRTSFHALLMPSTAWAFRHSLSLCKVSHVYRKRNTDQRNVQLSKWGRYIYILHTYIYGGKKSHTKRNI